MGLGDNIPTRYATQSYGRVPELVVGLNVMKGLTWFVNSNAAAGGNGTSWDSAYRTLQAAIDAASVDDLILIAPTHAENVASAGAITINKAGLRIVGLGNRARRATFTWTATDGTILITANDVLLSNIRHTCGIDEVVTAISITGARCVIDAVDYIETTNYQLIQKILTSAAADGIEVCNCRDVAATAAGSAQRWIQLVGVDDCDIHDNTFHLTLANSATSITISGSTALVRGFIRRNSIVQLGGTTQASAILLADGSTSLVHDNRCAVGSTALPGIVAVGTAGYACENYALNTPNKSGIIDPVADS